MEITRKKKHSLASWLLVYLLAKSTHPYKTNSRSEGLAKVDRIGIEKGFFGKISARVGLIRHIKYIIHAVGDAGN